MKAKMSDFRLRNLEASQFRKCVFYLALFTRLGAPGIGERTRDRRILVQ